MLNWALVLAVIAVVIWAVFDSPAKLNKIAWVVFCCAFGAWCLVVLSHKTLHP